MRNLVAAAICALALTAGVGAASAQNAAFTGDDFNQAAGTGYCWDLSIPNGVNVTTIEMRLTGGTGDADLKMFTGYGHNWGDAGHYCLRESGTNEENCSYETQTKYNQGHRQYTICALAYTTAANVGMIGGYTTPLNGSAAQQSAGTVTYYMTFYRDLLFWPAYHREGCITDWNGSTGKVVSDHEYDGFSDNNYCVKGEHWSSGPAAREAQYINLDANLGTNFTTAKQTADNCGQWTNLMHGHVESNKTQYLRRPPAVSYNIFTDNNSDCWIKDFGQCLGVDVPIAALGCVDE